MYPSKSSPLYKVIKDLFSATEEKLTICTPYFNLPLPLVKRIARLLKQGKKVELIVGDKRANDFYIPEDQPFQIISAIPYLYEKNLRKFIQSPVLWSTTLWKFLEYSIPR